MLKYLNIKNIALITNLEIEFGENLCVLTGETGAGKTIILDSLAFALGEKADKSLIKSGETKATVEAVFEISEESITEIVLEEMGFEKETTIILHRTMNIQGKNECRINGKICALSTLRIIANTLVDIFGQSEHVNFIKKEAHLDIIDNFNKFPYQQELSEAFTRYNQEKTFLKSLGGTDIEREQTLNFLEYQINEIESVNPSIEEEEKLLSTKDKIVNIEKIVESLKNTITHLTANNLSTEMWLAKTSLQQATKFDNSLEETVSKIETLKYELDDILVFLNDKLADCNYDPNEVDAIMLRLDEIKRLKRKYGPTVSDVLEFLENAKNKYDTLIDSSAKIEEISKKILKTKSDIYEISKKLSNFRQETSKEFCALIQSELSELGMPNSSFSMIFEECPSIDEFTPSEKGFDSAEFMFSANKGEPQKQLAKVISGGEMSRFLLAVKNITAKIEKIPTMIFDEVDVGISGNIAQVVAKKLANISRNFQCIVITHLPQVAAMADNNYFISKTIKNDKTTTNIELADAKLKIREVERLIGGANIGQYSKKHAEEMVDWANKYKESIN